MDQSRPCRYPSKFTLSTRTICTRLLHWFQFRWPSWAALWDSICSQLSATGTESDWLKVGTLSTRYNTTGSTGLSLISLSVERIQQHKRSPPNWSQLLMVTKQKLRLNLRSPKTNSRLPIFRDQRSKTSLTRWKTSRQNLQKRTSQKHPRKVKWTD